MNVRVERGQDLRNDPRVQAAVKDAEARLAGRGRVLLRPSGTEPVIRVMVEGEAADVVKGLADAIADTIRQQAGGVVRCGAAAGDALGPQRPETQ